MKPLGTKRFPMANGGLCSLLQDGRLCIDSILFATDFSPASYGASLYATALAEHFKSVLTLLHVFLPSQSAQEAEARDGVISDQRRQVQQKLELTAQALAPPGGKVTTVLLEGDPAVVLAREANKCRGTLLVLGTHGGNTVERHVIGSVAESALRGSAVPTITVGPHVAASGVPVPFQRILYVTDSSPIAAKGAPLACSFAKSYSSVMQVVSVIDEATGPVSRILADLDFRTREELTASLTERCVHFDQPRGVVYSKHAHHEILRRLHEDRCDLLVLGIEQKSHLGFADRNSGAFRVISDSPCPVLTITDQSCPS